MSAFPVVDARASGGVAWGLVRDDQVIAEGRHVDLLVDPAYRAMVDRDEVLW
ncbi:hypothetical protein ACTG9Q_16665 [Actinokineospora sp. 24-640]